MQYTMMGYIYDQVELLKRTLENKKEYTEDLINLFKKYPFKKIYMIGSGTSYHVSILAKNYFEKYLNVEVTVSIPTVFTNHERFNNNKIYQNDEILVIAISQSGTSHSTADALKRAQALGFCTVVFTEDLRSPITEFADHILHMQCEKERIPPETKGYTTAALSAFLWAVEISKALDCMSESQYNSKIQEVRDMILMVPKVIEESKDWFERNKYELLMAQKLDVAGYGVHYVTAIEAALKIGETFKRKAVGHELEELIHGTEMGYDANNYVMLTGADESEFGRMLEIRRFLQNITDHVFVITSEKIESNQKDCILSVKTTAELSPILNVIPFQIYAAMATEAVGIDTSVYPHKILGLGHSHDE